MADTDQDRWYVVDKDGIAVLRNSHAVAVEDAEALQRTSPHRGPYIVTRLTNPKPASEDGLQTDFLPCCDNALPDGIEIHRMPAPWQLRGNLYLVLCKWCGKSAPFVSLGRVYDGDVMPRAIAEWNRRLAGGASHGEALALLRELRAHAALDPYWQGRVDPVLSRAELPAAEQSALPSFHDTFKRGCHSLSPRYTPAGSARLATTEQPGSSVQGEAQFVPGVMHCAKCKFRLVRTNFHAADGSISAGDNKTEPCPNGCGPLWPVTWEQEAREGWARLEQMATTPPPAPAAVTWHRFEDRLPPSGVWVMAKSRLSGSVNPLSILAEADARTDLVERYECWHPIAAPAAEQGNVLMHPCMHPRATVNVGPTTDQLNHYCPDCGASWTTWPERNTSTQPEARGVDDELRALRWFANKVALTASFACKGAISSPLLLEWIERAMRDAGRDFLVNDGEAT